MSNIPTPRKERITQEMTIPSDILHHADMLHTLTEVQGWKHWELGHVADRRLVFKLQDERDTNQRHYHNSMAEVRELRQKNQQLRDGIRSVPAVWYGPEFVQAQAREIEGLKAEIDHLKFKINDLTNYTSYTPT